MIHSLGVIGIVSYLFYSTDPKLRDCLPSDFIFGGETYGQIATTADCHKDCLKTEYEESVAISEVLTEPIVSQNKLSQEGSYKVEPSRVSVLQFYFRSLDYANFIQYQEPFSDFLCK